MKSPTRDDLNRLLWSDEASASWEGDAREILDAADQHIKPPLLERVQEVIDVVGSECDGVRDLVDGEDDRDDLEALACHAKRSAILLLHAAWAAEKKLERMPT